MWAFAGAYRTQASCRLFFKCENFQKVGAFKIRGAMNTLLALEEELGIEELRKRGVVTHSSGNHAQALACAAQKLAITGMWVTTSERLRADC